MQFFGFYILINILFQSVGAKTYNIKDVKLYTNASTCRSEHITYISFHYL